QLDGRSFAATVRRSFSVRTEFDRSCWGTSSSSDIVATLLSKIGRGVGTFPRNHHPPLWRTLVAGFGVREERGQGLGRRTNRLHATQRPGLPAASPLTCSFRIAFWVAQVWRVSPCGMGSFTVRARTTIRRMEASPNSYANARTL